MYLAVAGRRETDGSKLHIFIMYVKRVGATFGEHCAVAGALLHQQRCCVECLPGTFVNRRAHAER